MCETNRSSYCSASTSKCWRDCTVLGCSGAIEPVSFFPALLLTGVILHRALHLENVMHVGIEIPSQAPNGMEPLHINAARAGIIQVVTDMKIDNLAEHQTVRAMPDGENLHHPAFHTNGYFRHPRCLD